MPLRLNDRMLGFVTIITRTERVFTKDEEEILELFAGKAASALANARLHEATERALSEIQATNAELDSFVYSVSHDLKAPLVTIHGMSSMLLAECASGLGERGRHYLARIEANIGQMGRLISDLLALSRIGREGRPAELVSLTEVADEVLASQAEPVRARRVKVVRHELGSVWGVRVQLQQVLGNLIGNAVKYLGDSPDPQVEIGASHHDGWVECYVRDNGIGIDAAYHAQVFDLFQRLKEIPAEGTGVGLAIVKKIVEAAGGRVRVESAKGHGATFFFTWPSTPRPR
jgi:signal transduction histidine kinase